MGDNQLISTALDIEMDYNDVTDIESSDESSDENASEPDQLEESEESTEPLDVNYIITHEGIVQVPHTLIERDKGYPISITAQAWREHQKSHVRICASLFTANKIIDSKSIVCLTQLDAQGECTRCLWFVRLSVEGGSDKFERPFGENFLWQLGYPTCMKYRDNMKALYKLRNTPLDEQSRLCYELTPSNATFEPKEWPECQKITTLPCYYDRCFAMSLRPSRLPYIGVGENQFTKLRNLSRPPEFLDTLGVASMPFHSLPDDISDLIIDDMAMHLASSPYGTDAKAFLLMRVVSKSWKRAADNAAGRFLKGVLEKISLGHQTTHITDINNARDAVLHSGLVLYPVLCDHANAGILNWMRLRSGKCPLELPPDEILARVRALKKRIREDENDDSRHPATLRVQRAKSDNGPPCICVIED